MFNILQQLAWDQSKNGTACSILIEKITSVTNLPQYHE
jgi:hypothetical protein